MFKRNLLNNLYYNEESGYSGVEKLYRRAHSLDKRIGRDDVKYFLSSQPIAQQYFQQTKSKNSFVASGPLFEFQIDLTYIEDVHKKSYTYLLTCIDIFSKVGDIEIVKDKSGKSVLDGMIKILDRMGKPEQIYADKGREFTNKQFSDYMEEKGIKLILVRRKAPFVERFNKTIKDLLYKIMTDKGFSNWMEYLPKVLKNYNNSYHSTIGMTPLQVKDNEDLAFENIGLNSDIGYDRKDLEVGERVRVLLEKGSFSRGFKPNYSKSVYVVMEVDDDKVLLNDGNYYYTFDVKPVQGVDEDEEEDEGKNVKQNIKQKKIFKKEGLKEENIVTGKRERKPITFL